LAAVRDRVGHALSSGMRARLQLGRALMHNPRVLILDEPTSTIDPLSAHELLTLIRKLASEHQMAVLLSSHRLEEIDALQDNVLFLNRGAAVHTGSIDSLRAAIEQPLLLLRFGTENHARLAADHLRSVEPSLHVDISAASLAIQAGDLAPGALLQRLGPYLSDVVGVDRTRMPLQELIAELMREGDEHR
jgi:ABC-2 type transport system ATP-binding protein